MTSVFKSPYPSIQIPKTSYFQFLVEDGKASNFSPDAPAYIDGLSGETISRGALERECLLLAAGLRNVDKKGLEGLNRGSVVLVFSPNTIQYPRVQLALAAAGVCPAHAGSAYLESELAHAVKISKASHFLVHPALLTRLVKALGYSEDEVKRRVILMDRKKNIPAELKQQGWIDLDDLVDGVRPLDRPESFDGDLADETAAIYFSSGSTGLPKAVALSHYNIVAFVLQYVETASLYVHGQDIILAILPFYHVFSGILLAVNSQVAGCPLVILPRFEPELFLSCIQKYRLTSLPIVPPILQFLLKHPLVNKYDISSVRWVFVGAAPLSADATRMAIDLFRARGAANVVLIQGYGMTETCGGISYLPIELMVSHAGSIGHLISNIEGKVVDDDGAVVPLNTPGELWIKGPNVMKGYVGNPEATKETLTPDGWLKTGDVMTVDENGFMTVVDRKKELIKYKGFQVAPAELEAVLFTHPQVADVGVIGVYSDKHTSEVPLAYIVPKDATLFKKDNAERQRLIDDIHTWLKDKIASYKLLRGGIILVESVPKSAAGKILRKDLRALYQSTHATKARL